MEIKELKFLLKLLGHEGYRASITKLQPNKETSASERNKICRALAKTGRVAYSQEIKQFKISDTGKGLLKKEEEAPYLTENHFLILKACESETIMPGKLKKIPVNDRQLLIHELEAKGLIDADTEKAQIKEVWLTERGAEYLRDEYNANGNTTISLNLLGNYLNFLRKGTRSASAKDQLPSVESVSQEKPTDEKILQTIRHLDQELGTNNYLPIFHLRKTLQPPLSRDELDQALYRLQREDKLDLSSLVEAIHYTSEEIQAGISQDDGSPLFFLIVNE
jgi:predicted transcriptional regulator